MWGVRIQGQIVLLRPIAEEELPLLVGWQADAEVLRLAGIGYHAMAPADLKKWWQEAGTQPTSLHWGLEWEGRLVGRTAIHEIDWLNRRAWTATMLGDKSAWRHGIATEAMALRTEHAFRQLNLHKLGSGYAETNVGSGEAQRRAGYREVARFKEQLYRDGRWYDEIVTEVLREDWEAEHPLA
ncbi:MAG: GNAT family N-acetyltransferase [Candidatus Dormibacteraceae bacterium]